ncbi:MAG: hypothetical protein KA715_00735 [Xanthomonadaceae bacterium]|nr:hypothetical protein [Xanthomonadaceae bacterium]
MSSCATTIKTENFNDQELREHLKQACKLGKEFTSVKGSLWAKIKSKKEELQFPATIRVANKQLVLEITNLVGGREAVIRIDDELFSVLSDSRPGLNQKGKGTWNMIPVSWAFKAFLGQPPCLDEIATAHINREKSVHGAIALNFAGEIWIYELESTGTRERIIKLTRESKDSVKKLEIEFERFDVSNGTPLSFRAASEEGELKIRWKERTIE